MTLLATMLIAPAFADPGAAETLPAAQPVAAPASGGSVDVDPAAFTALPRPAKERQFTTLVQALNVPAVLVSLNGEVGVSRRLTVAGRAGLGAREAVALYDLGVEGRYYLHGDFDGGFFTGLGVGRTNVTPRTFGETAYTAQAFVGGKLVHASGFTVEGVTGIGGYVSRVHMELSPTARVAVGWSL